MAHTKAMSPPFQSLTSDVMGSIRLKRRKQICGSRAATAGFCAPPRQTKEPNLIEINDRRPQEELSSSDKREIAMKNFQWEERGDGSFVTEKGRFELTVRRQSGRPFVRFEVMARRRIGARSMVGSGTAADIGRGMRSAENMAERFLRNVPLAEPEIMVVDDDASVRDVLADALRDEGFEVAEVASAEGALVRLERSALPRVLVTDVNLGSGMTGLELAAAVHELWPTVGVLLISADAEGLADGAQPGAFLAKPFSTDDLLEQVLSIANDTLPPANAAPDRSGADLTVSS